MHLKYCHFRSGNISSTSKATPKQKSKLRAEALRAISPMRTPGQLASPNRRPLPR